MRVRLGLSTAGGSSPNWLDPPYSLWMPIIFNLHTLSFSLLVLAVVVASDPVAGGVPEVEHVMVYHQKGRFGGWPANHGIWSWGSEILVGFSAGHHKDLGPARHNSDHD